MNGLQSHRPRPRRTLAALLLVLALVPAAVARAEGHRSTDELGDRAASARARAADARAEERALAGDVAAQSEQIDRIESDIAGLRNELGGLERTLDRSKASLRRLESELAEQTRTLARARQALAIARTRLAERLVRLYTSSEPEAIAVALGASTLDELLDVLEARARVVEHDASLIRKTQALRARVTRGRVRTTRLKEARALETARIESRTDERRAALASLVARRDSLAGMRAARTRSLASVQVERREWEAQADALEAESARLSSIVAAPPPAAAPSGQPEPAPSSSGSGLVWPVRGTLVSPYGQRWGRLHSGIDIAAPAGTPIVAAASGAVIYSGAMSGYGLIVIVRHAGGITTAYAHNSANAVSVGQSVGQGQTIASVGCSGHCYGDHVHFEVRVGGGTVDPMGHL